MTRNAVFAYCLMLAVIACGFVATWNTQRVYADYAAWAMDDAHQRDNAITVAVDTAVADNTLVAAVAGKQYKVIDFFFQAEGSVDVSFYSDSTAKTGPVAFTASDTQEAGNLHLCPIAMDRGEALKLILSTTVQVNGWVTYVVR